jgi:hypothetical protein
MLYHVNTQTLLEGVEAGLALCYSGGPRFKSGYGFRQFVVYVPPGCYAA